LKIQDVFVLSPSGLPYFSKCYGGDFCKLQPDHTLQTGFLAAMYQFSGDFGQKTIDMVRFDQISLHFKPWTDKDFIIVFAVSVEDDEKEVKEKLLKAGEAFRQKFGDQVRTGEPINDEVFEDFIHDLEPILEKKPMMTIPLHRKFSFLGRLRNSRVWKRFRPGK
jgi:hypothetical protein